MNALHVQQLNWGLKMTFCYSRYNPAITEPQTGSVNNRNALEILCFCSVCDMISKLKVILITTPKTSRLSLLTRSYPEYFP